MTHGYDQTWERFLETGRVSDYYRAWNEWAAGRTPVYSFVIPVGPHQELTDRVRQVQLPLRNLPGVDLVPFQALHLTVQMVGFEGEDGGPDELTAGELARLREDARSIFSRTPAFSAHLGGVNSFADAPFIEVDDGGATGRLRQELQSVCPQLKGGDKPYLPHLSLGYYSGDMPNGRFAAALASFRDLDVGKLRVGSVDLVATPVIKVRHFAPPRLVERYELGTAAFEE